MKAGLARTAALAGAAISLLALDSMPMARLRGPKRSALHKS